MDNLKILQLFLALTFMITNEVFAASSQHIPTTLEGPFQPVTRRFDASLRRGSDDLPMDHPRLRKNVTSNFPEQIALALSTPSSLWVSWLTGDAQIGLNVTPLDPTTVASEVWYGKQSGKYTAKKSGISLIYSQLYPFEGLLNYTSGIIHHVKIDGLEPKTKYYYKCGDSSIDAMSEEHVFETLPLPSSESYPCKIAVVGDLGLTSNSTTTIDHLISNDPCLVLMVGDLAYANQYLTTGGKGASCYSCAFPDSPTRETYQPRWDGWGRFMQPVTSRVPMMVIQGNHEIEPQANDLTFVSYMSRFSVPAEESGSDSNMYYSFDAGGVHFVMLGAYVDYNKTGDQYAWLERDLENVDRGMTPWLVVTWHPPWYNSYSSHYQEFECMRLQMEALLHQHGVDIVFSGHVHAYERMNRVYNYTLDPCGPVYITVGDGGNIEQVDVDHADEEGNCPSPSDNVPEFGSVCHTNFSFGPGKGGFCWERQPEWSAYRESSFGHGMLEVVNLTYALWTWHRNQDIYKENSRGDQIYIVRQPELCLAGSKAKDFWREAKIISTLHHPNTVAFYGVVPDGPGETLATVTEYLVSGSLPHVLLRKDRVLDRRRKVIIALDAAFGMEYLHLKNIVHFDLKCDNLLVNLGDPHRPVCKGYEQHMVSTLLHAGGIVSDSLRPPVSERCDLEWRKLMEQCWSHEPEARPPFWEITRRLQGMSEAILPKRVNRVKR